MYILFKCSKIIFDSNQNLLTPPPYKNYSFNDTLFMKKSCSYFVAFLLKAKLLAEAIASKDTSRSRNTIKKFNLIQILKNKPTKPEQQYLLQPYKVFIQV